MSFLRTSYYLVTRVLRRPKFISDFYRFRSLQKDSSKQIKWDDILPVLNESTSSTGFDTHYIYHPAWAARIVKKINPDVHIDISSTLHFSTQLSAFIPTQFYDYRPAKLNLSQLSSGKTDLCNMHFESNSIQSLSCMHTIEHIGLGRYGDPLDPDGDKKAANELRRVVAHGGHLLLVTPVGRERIMFNGHRIYSFETILSLFPEFELMEFSLIPDNALEVGIINKADPALVASQQYGCGCFWFKKR